MEIDKINKNQWKSMRIDAIESQERTIAQLCFS